MPCSVVDIVREEPVLFLFFPWSGLRLSPLGTSATNWPIVPAPDDRWWWIWSSQWNENSQGKPKYSEKTCPSATLSTTNPTWPDLGWNLGHRSGKLATNRLSYGIAMRDLFSPSSMLWTNFISFLLAPVLVLCSLYNIIIIYSYTLKVTAAASSKMLENFYRTTWHYTPEDSNLYGHFCENLKSHKVLLRYSQK
jgi:hypothetical protein